MTQSASIEIMSWQAFERAPSGAFARTSFALEVVETPDRAEILTEVLSDIGPLMDQYGEGEVWDVAPLDLEAATTVGAARIDLHTEMAEFPLPPEVIALLCVRPAKEGGLLRLLAAKKLLACCDEDLLRALENEPTRFATLPSISGRFPGTEYKAPILTYDEEGNPVLRFSSSVLRRKEKPEFLTQFSDVLEAAENAAGLSFRQKSHSMLLWRNAEVMHGRTAFRDPQRLLRRVCIMA